MGKVDENKQKKKEALLNTAFKLFSTKGIHGTSISDIVNEAGVAKGTFYLYFKDKYDIKNKLVAHKTHELFMNANKKLEERSISGLEDQMIFIIDHIIDELMENPALLSLISKNLVMGALRSALLTGEDSDQDIYEHFHTMVNEDCYEYEEVDIMLFTIVELAGSTAYNSIQYEEPVAIEKYKPYLYRSVRLIIQSHRINKIES